MNLPSALQQPTAEPRPWLLLSLLTASMVVSFADRTVLAMMIKPIKAELGLTDTAIGILNGFAFAAFYACCGLALARMADRGRHRTIILGSLVVWSVMTALCGVAQNFWQLLLARFGVGAGEAGIVPAGQSVLVEAFAANRRNTAISVFMAGGPLGILLAYLVTGGLESALGWRATFLMMGAPGLLLALAFAPMPFKRRANGTSRPAGAATPLLRDSTDILAIPRVRWTMVVIICLSLLTFGQAQWLPAYIERTFALPRPTIGPMLALTQGVGMLIGTAAGGPVFDRLARSSKVRPESLITALCISGVPVLSAVYLVGDAKAATALAGVAAVILGLPSGRLWAGIHAEVPVDRRASAVALSMLLASVIGQGVGPVAIGLLSDLLTASRGANALRYALLVTVSCGGVALIAACFRNLLLARVRGPAS